MKKTGKIVLKNNTNLLDIPGRTWDIKAPMGDSPHGAVAFFIGY